MTACVHEYIARETGQVRVENLAGSAAVRLLYRDFPLGRQGPARLFSGEWATRLAARAYFDAPAGPRAVHAFARRMGVDESEMETPLSELRSRTEVFARRIRYEDVRPLTELPQAVAAPADSKLIACSWADMPTVRIKERFFDLPTLIGGEESSRRFAAGTFGIFRLAPPDYHYFHAPVAGRVVALREMEGRFFSVNPLALAHIEQVLSSNRRVVIEIDTDADGGTGVGRVAVVPIAAQVIGRIALGYSPRGYEGPVPVREGLWIDRGRPLGLFLPGSSTVVCLFEPGRIEWCPDLLFHRDRPGVRSLYAAGIFGRTLSEVRVRVRDTVAFRAGTMPQDRIPLGGGRFLVRSADGPGWTIRTSFAREGPPR